MLVICMTFFYFSKSYLKHTHEAVTEHYYSMTH